MTQVEFEETCKKVFAASRVTFEGNPSIVWACLDDSIFAVWFCNGDADCIKDWQYKNWRCDDNSYVELLEQNLARLKEQM